MYKRFFIITLLLLNVWLMHPVTSIAQEGRITFDELGIALFTLKPKEKRDFQIMLLSGDTSSGPIAGANHEVKLTVAKGESFSGTFRLHAVGCVVDYRVSVNGIQLYQESPCGIDRKISLPSGLLNVGENTLTLENFDSMDEMGVLNDTYFEFKVVTLPIDSVSFADINVETFIVKPKTSKDIKFVLLKYSGAAGTFRLHAIGCVVDYRVSVNGIQLYQESPCGIDRKISLPSGLLNVGENTLTLENFDSMDEMGVLNDTYFIIPGVFGSLDENSPPSSPPNISPANRSDNVSVTPTLNASVFSDKDAGDTHKSSQWQITTKAGDYTSPVYDSGVDAKNLTSITVPKGKLDYVTVYYWHVRYQDSKGAWSNYSEETRFTTKLTGNDVYTATLALKKGINIISPPLNPDTPYTASTLAVALNATIVIQVKDGLFDAYVRAGSIGTDFPIQMGQGYIVNLMEAKTFNITGKPWGEPVPVAPSTRNRVFPKNSVSVEPWAFVIAGRIEGTVPDGGRLRIINLHTGEKLIASISPSGEFTAVYINLNRHPVIAQGDEIILQLIGMGGVSLTEAKRYIISHQEVAQAYLITHLSTKIEQTTVLQNYPNPFNPETWIPFQLAEPAAVTINICTAHGQLIRTLGLGQQNAGFYVNRSKAAYWNGRNEAGEKVASGIYFYQLKAGDVTATRRMVIVK